MFALLTPTLLVVAVPVFGSDVRIQITLLIRCLRALVLGSSRDWIQGPVLGNNLAEPIHWLTLLPYLVANPLF